MKHVDNAGEIIRQLRVEHGMSLRSLAKLANIDASYLSKMEKGTQPVSIKILRKIGDALGYDMKVALDPKQMKELKK